MNKIAPQDMRQHLMLNQARLSAVQDVVQEIEDYWMQPRSLRVTTRTKLDSLLQLVKALRKLENLIECHVTLERVVAQRAKDKWTKDSGFNPSVVNSDSLVDTSVGVGESVTKKPSVRF